MKIPLLQKLTNQRLSVQEKDRLNDVRFAKSSVIGTVLIVLSGLILYADKAIVFFNINIPLPSRYEDVQWDLETFIWMVSASISPILLIIAANFKSHKIAYIVPLYCYTLQIWFILFDFAVVDKGYLGWYAFGSCVFIVMIYFAYNKIEAQKILKRIEKEQQNLT